jgi:acyl carrier protein
MHEVRDEIAAWLAGRGVVWAQRAAAGQAFADVGWTSLDVIRLVAFLQSHFRIQLAPEVFFGGRAANLDALAALVHELRSR